MAELNERDTKLVQYLTEAYGKEKELETALEAHIGMTNRAPYKKRLQQHLKETKSHGREIERRIKKLGGSTSDLTTTATTAAKKALALGKGSLQALRGSSDPEKELKNARDEFAEEAQEIALYTAIESLATAVGDKDTAKIARTIRRDEERMAGYLERLIPQLTKAVATTEIPASQRSTGRRRSTSSRRRTTSARSTASRSSSTKRSTTKRSTASRRSSSSSRNGSSASTKSSGSRSRSRSSGSRARARA